MARKRALGRPQSGLTLVEILVSVAISAILIMAAYSVYAAATGSWNASRRRMDMQQRARVALDLISRCLRTAQVPNSTSDLTFEGEDIGVDNGTDSNGNAVSLSEDTIVFRTNAPLHIFGDKEIPDQAKVQFYLEPVDETTASGPTPTPSALRSAPTPAPAGTTSTDVVAPSTGVALLMRVDSDLSPQSTDTTGTSPESSTGLSADTSADTGWILELVENIEQLNFSYFDGTEWVDTWTSSQGVPKVVEVTIVVDDPEGKENPKSFSCLCPIEAWRQLSTSTSSSGTSTTDQQQNQNSGGNTSGNGSDTGGSDAGTNAPSSLVLNGE